MQTLKTTWTGFRPLVMHNGLLADPTNPYTRKIKEITSKGSKKMTDSDYEERDRLEWEGGLYWDDELGLIIPSDNIERCIQLGAQKSRLGKDVQAAVFCVEPVIEIGFTGLPDVTRDDGSRDWSDEAKSNATKVRSRMKSKETMLASPEFTLRKGVAIQKARLIRVRPMIPTGWSLSFTLEFDDSIVNLKSVAKAMQDAGSLVGLGDWRPKFGRFMVEVE